MARKIGSKQGVFALGWALMWATAACGSTSSRSAGNDPGAGGGASTATNTTATTTSTVVGEACQGDGDCAVDDATNCQASCQAVSGEKRCVTTGVDADGDKHTTSACEAAPGDDCDDADPLSYAGALAMSVVGEAPSCADGAKGTCAKRGHSISWSAEGTPYLTYVDETLVPVGGFVMQALDAGGRPTGAVQTLLPQDCGSMKNSADFETASGTEGSDIAVVWLGNAGADWTPYVAIPSFAPGTHTLTVPAGIEPTVFASNGVRLGTPGVVNDHLSVAVGQDNVQTTWWVTETGGDAVWLTQGGSFSTITRGTITALSGDFRAFLVGDAPAEEKSRLVVRVFPANGKIGVQQGTDVILIPNSGVTAISPNAAIGALDGGFVAFYRDVASATPLSARLIDTNGNALGKVKTYDSSLLPREILDTPGPGGVLIAERVLGENHLIVAQAIGGDLSLVGDPADLGEAATAEPSHVRARGFGGDGAVTYRQGGSFYRLFHVNTCHD